MILPLVTVAICTYNGEQYISDTLDSVLAQTYNNWEIVIVDDGSSDGTVAIIRRYAKRDGRIRFFVRKNMGLPASRNFSFKQARGEWIAIIDQDDLCYPDRLKKQVEVAANFPSAGLIFCDTDYIDEVGQNIGSHLHSFSLPGPLIPKGVAGHLLIIKGCYVDSEACFIKRTTVDCLGPLDESLLYACDYEYFIRAGLKYDFAYTCETLSAWRIHPKQESVTNFNRFKEYRSVLNKYLLHSEVNLYLKLIIIFNLVRSHGGEIYRELQNLLRKLNNLRRHICHQINIG
jgi:glycosyltransferase involved in cell wall biosynthesis